MSKLRPGRQDYNATFLDTLDRLNPAQKSAVDQIEGPVLVVAGPGTGKTHILAARIGKILLETDTQPNNILCLTFTDAGVIAMRDRLVSFIGPEAYRVHIFTFHSFCNSVIQDNLEVFGRQDMEPLSELDRIDLIRRILARCNPDHPLRLGMADPFFYENHLFQLFQRMKMEDWTHDFLIQKVEAYLAALPNHPAFIYQRKSGKNKKGDPKEAKIKAYELRMQKLIAAAKLYPIYEKEKLKARRYDFSDMILWVLRAFEENEHLLRNYQEQYLYLLIDEYQDTNGSQNELIQRLVDYWELPNLFIVGDDDQSIYEFQGARLKNLTDFHQRYLEDIKLIVLQENYRSTQTILDTSRGIIERNEIRIVEKLPGLSKVLQAARPNQKAADQTIEIKEYGDQQEELVAVLEKIQKLHQQGVAWEEMAVIYAKHQQSLLLTHLMSARKIPFQTRRRTNVLETPIITKVLKLLEYFAAELRHAFSGAHHLFEILHFDFLQIPPREISQLSYYLAKIPMEERPHWRQVMGEKEQLEKAKLKEVKVFLQLSEQLDYLLGVLANQSAPVFLERMLNRLQVVAYTIQQDDKLSNIRYLNTFINFVKEEYRRRPKLRLEELLATIHRMERNRIPLAIESLGGAGEGVQLLTAHSAKGLEFGQVFLFGLTKKNWEPNARGSSFQFSIPPNLTLSGEEDALEARRRLFYVALTRAKDQLHLSYASSDDKGKIQQRARFIDELLASPKVILESPEMDKELLLEYQVLQLTTPQEISIQPAPKAIIDELLAGFKLSISALNTYLRCPLSFYYTYVVQAPALMSETAAYGKAMHNALQRLFLRMQQSKPRNFPSEKDFLSLFEQEMQRYVQYFSPSSFEQYQKKGRYTLGRYYQHHYGQWSKRVVVEYTIRTAEIDGVPVSGTIDKIEFGKQQAVHIVDYKTGSHNKDKLRVPDEKHPYGGSYWRQLLFYKLLYENFDQTGRIAKSGEIAYLDPDASGQFVSRTLEYDLGDLQKVKSYVKESYQQIMAHNFYTGCNEENCHWCNFVKNQVLPDSLFTPEQEELDD